MVAIAAACHVVVHDNGDGVRALQLAALSLRRHISGFHGYTVVIVFHVEVGVLQPSVAQVLATDSQQVEQFVVGEAVGLHVVLEGKHFAHVDDGDFSFRHAAADAAEVAHADDKFILMGAPVGIGIALADEACDGRHDIPLSAVVVKVFFYVGHVFAQCRSGFCASAIEQGVNLLLQVQGTRGELCTLSGANGHDAGFDCNHLHADGVKAELHDADVVAMPIALRDGLPAFVDVAAYGVVAVAGKEALVERRVDAFKLFRVLVVPYRLAILHVGSDVHQQGANLCLFHLLESWYSLQAVENARVVAAKRHAFDFARADLFLCTRCQQADKADVHRAGGGEANLLHGERFHVGRALPGRVEHVCTKIFQVPPMGTQGVGSPFVGEFFLSIVKFMVADGGDTYAGLIEEDREQLALGGGVEVAASEVVACRDRQMVGVDTFQGIQRLEYGGCPGDVLVGILDESTMEVVEAQDGNVDGAILLLRIGRCGKNAQHKNKEKRGSVFHQFRMFGFGGEDKERTEKKTAGDLFSHQKTLSSPTIQTSLVIRMKLISWNVNGLRACDGKGFRDTFARLNADVFCVQETKMQEGQLDIEFPGYESYWDYAEKKGYSGTAVFTRQKPLSVRRGIGVDEHGHEGRAVTLEFEDYFLVNVYVPNSQDGLRRLDYRMRWEDDFLSYVSELDKLKPVIVCGDMNVAHEEIDLKNPSTNRRNAGFTDEEREKMTALLAAGFTDTFRYFFPSLEGAYSWWSYRGGARQRNAGWRIDYFLCSNRLRPRLVGAAIHSEVMGSDHCPVELLITPL